MLKSFFKQTGVISTSLLLHLFAIRARIKDDQCELQCYVFQTVAFRII